MFTKLRNSFITGIALILPLAITIIVVNFLLDKIGAPSSNLLLERFVDPQLLKITGVETGLDILALLFVTLTITLFGFFSKYFIGRYFILTAEKILGQVPFINTVYKTVKQIVDTFSKQDKSVFQKVVLIEYPRKNCYVIGFLTSYSKGEVQNKVATNLINIFVPTTPNPTSGFLLMLPEDEAIKLEMSVGEGMKLIISGGAVVPPFQENKPHEKVKQKTDG